MDQDRERLKEVHQTDLTESRVNEDFVDWLKTKGPTYLLIILVGVTAYLAIVRWRMHKQQRVDDAWYALSEAALPNSKLDVAEQHADQFAVPQLALNGAGSQLLRAVQSGQTVESLGNTAADGSVIPPTPEDELTAEERETYLDRADQAFARVVAQDDGSMAMTLHVVRALEGRAAVAEARGDAGAARTYYEQAAKRVEPVYPDLAEQARERIASLDEATMQIELVQGSADENPGIRPFTPPFSPASIDPSLRNLVMPDTGAGG